MSKLKAPKLHKRSAEAEARRLKRRDAATLDGALKQVGMHEQPRLTGQDAFGTIRIKERDATGREHWRTKVTALRDDPIGLMYRRGQLRREGDRDDNDAAVRFEALRWYQAQYIAAEIGGARAIDLTIPKVDGGAGAGERDRLDAVVRLAEIDATVGRLGGLILRMVAGEGRKIHEVAGILLQQSNWDRRYIGRRLVEIAQEIAEMRGLVLRPRQPRRVVDQWSIFARYARHPELIKAILRGRNEA